MAGCRRCRPRSSRMARRNAASARRACWSRRRRCWTRNPSPTEAEVQDALGGVLCRCTGYRKIIAAVMDASRQAALPRSPHARSPATPSARRRSGSTACRRSPAARSFGADCFPADALAVLVVRSPHYHASFTFGDLDAWAKAHPGIVGVFTAADIPGQKLFRRHRPVRRPAGAGRRLCALSRRGGGAGRRRARGHARSRPVGFPGPLDRTAAFPAAWRGAGRRRRS